MKILLGFKRLDLTLQAAAAVAPFLIWVALWGRQQDALFDGIHPLHAFVMVGAVQLVSLLLHLLPIGSGVWMRPERAAYLGSNVILLSCGAIAYFSSNGPSVEQSSAITAMLFALPIEFLVVLLVVSPILAVWYFWICWSETRAIVALNARKNLLVR